MCTPAIPVTRNGLMRRLVGGSQSVCPVQAAQILGFLGLASFWSRDWCLAARGAWQPTCLEGVCMHQQSIAQPPISAEVRSDLAVLIPARNEERVIARCVASVIDAGIAPEHVFVIDDESTDGTVDVLRCFSGINVLRNPQRKGKAAGLSHAIDHYALCERYAFIALLDADSYVDARYFAAVSSAFADDPKAVLVCGSPRGLAHNYLTAFRTLDYYSALLLYKKAQDNIGVITVAPGCASTYRTSIVRALDWHGGTLVEDMDLTVQIHRKRLGRVRYAGDAIVYTQDPRRLREYVGQLTRWYSGTWQVMRQHRLPLGRQAVDVEFSILVGEGLFYSLLVLALPVLAWLWPQATLRWVLLEQGVFAISAIACAIHLRRPDVLVWFPTFAALRFIGCGIWLRTFWCEVVRRRTLRTWFSVGRYETNGPHHAGPSLA